jgi:hypothetical protein
VAEASDPSTILMSVLAERSMTKTFESLTTGEQEGWLRVLTLSDTPWLRADAYEVVNRVEAGESAPTGAKFLLLRLTRVVRGYQPGNAAPGIPIP